jgi:saccharopine dehydrogenase-like NADP-dependent oxidoreductase
MVKEKGARHLLLLSRSGLKSDAAVRAVEDLRRSGARIEAPQCDICDEDKLHSLLKDYGHVLPPISGCIQACMVLKVEQPSPKCCAI